jgi:hypothetical protein
MPADVTLGQPFIMSELSFAVFSDPSKYIRPWSVSFFEYEMSKKVRFFD